MASGRDIVVAPLVTPRVVTVDVQQDAGVALRMLATEPTPCVLACRDEVPVGIVTLRDLGAVCAAYWPNLAATRLRVEQIMSSPLIVVRAEATLADLIPILLRSELEYMAVVREGKLVGVLERAKLFRACLKLLAA